MKFFVKPCYKIIKSFIHEKKKKKQSSLVNICEFISMFLLIIATLIQPNGAGRACLRSPCLHGLCIDQLNSLTRQCYCRNGFTGYSCEINWDECRPMPCLNGGECFDAIADFNCSCPENFVGTRCELDLSKCDEYITCYNNATCSYNPNNATGFSCVCPPGFTGKNCEADVSVCTTQINPCIHGDCIDGLGIKFSCQCHSGWTGTTCELEFDECASNPCNNGAACIDEVNGFSCACPFGYTGKTCETKLKICDENPCLNNAFCIIEDGKKTCLCVPDYHGLLCEEKYDECQPEPQCQNNGTCVDGVGGFNCTCPIGFFGDLCECVEETGECGQSYNSSSIGTTTIMTSTIFPTSTLSTYFESTPWASPIPSPYPTASQGSESEGPYDPCPTLSVGEDRSHYSEMDSSFIQTSSLSVSPSSTYFASHSVWVSSETEYQPSVSIETTEILVTTDSQKPLSTTKIPPGLESSTSLHFPSDSFSGESQLLTDQSFETDIELTTRAFFPSETRDIITTAFPPSIFVSTSSSPLPIDSELLHPSGTPIFSDSSGLISTFQSEFQSQSEFLSSSVSIERTIFQSEYPDSSSKFPLDSGSSEHSTTFYSVSPEITPDITSTGEDLSMPFTISVDIVSSFDAIIPSSGGIIKSSMYSSPGTQFDTITPTFPFQTEFLSEISSYSSHQDSKSRIPYSSSTPIYSSDELVSPIESSTTVSFPIITETLILPPESESILYSSMDVGDSMSELPQIVTFTIGTDFPGSTLTSRHFVETVTLTPSPPTPSVTPPLGTIDSAVFESQYSIGQTITQLRPSPTMSVDILPTATPTTNLTDPCLNYCQNNQTAKCVFQSVEPPVCHCLWKFTGERCELRREKVFVPSLKGNSFLTYQVPLESVRVLDISIKLKTLIPDGIIMYTEASKGKTYALIFMQGGLLTLHFSCGSQSMNFVETRTRVDNGFNFTINFRMETLIREKNEVHCVGELRVNGSYKMSGEQLVGPHDQFEIPSSAVLHEIFIGGVPIRVSQSDTKGDQLLSFLPGFRGCIYELSISQEKKDLFDEATDGGEITECGSLACIINPCAANSMCVASGGKPPWECICPPGFGGSKCQIPVCSSNPCLHGSTCYRHQIGSNTTTQNNNDTSDSSCLCTLGFTGPLCQKPLNIQKPSFHPTSDYSSFVSYKDIPTLDDWFQLKFNFVTKNMTQFALLLYTGNKNTPEATSLKRNVRVKKSGNFSENGSESDFFALSFLQGYIALTWNLGAGTQRIMTPSRINPRLEIHSLYVGRHGRFAWIKVDGMRNTTGKTAGPLHHLNVNTDLYIGGYESFQLEGLPHDFPMHRGFQGCVFDLGFRVKNKIFLPNMTAGRNVKNCFEDDC